MDIQLAYGKDGLTLSVPDHALAGVLNRKGAPPIADPLREVAAALESPIGSPPLKELARAAGSACVVVCDFTRPVPNALLLPPVLRQLEEGGISRDQITILVATGLHRACTAAEHEAMLGADIAGRWRVVDHDARNGLEQEYLGITSLGTPIFIDRVYTKADLKVTIGFIEPHLMAGFSGGRKLVAPGCAGEQTIRVLHSPRFLERPECREGNLEGNPLHEDLLDIAAIAGHDFVIDVALDAERRITGVFAGNPVKAHERGVGHVRNSVGARMPAAADIVVTTGGGYPLDTTLYQTVKGMTAAMPVVKRGGVLVIAAECSEGLGGPEFAALATRYQTGTAFMNAIDEAPVEIDQWQLEECAKVVRHAAVVLVSPGIHREFSGRLLVRTTATLGEAMAYASEQCGPNARIAVIPEGPYTLVSAG